MVGQSPDGDVVFFQAGGMVLGLWDRAKLADDSVVTDSGGWGGVTLAYCARSEQEVDTVVASEVSRRGHRPGTGPDRLGRLLRVVHRPGRAPVGGSPQPGMDPGQGRIGEPAGLTRRGAQCRRRAPLVADRHHEFTGRGWTGDCGSQPPGWLTG